MSMIDAIKRRAAIVDVARRYAEVKRSGPGRWACRCLCGQNTDRHPSFMLYERDDHFHCFACQRHGDVIDLVGLCEGCDTREAVRRLGRAFGEAPARERVPRPPPPDPVSPPEARRALNAAVAHYAHALDGSPEVGEYLTARRGLSDATIRRLRIGYAPGHGLARALHAAGIDLALAARAGLIGEGGEHLRERVIVPVLDGGDAVFLLGRALRPGQQPKYLGLRDGLAHKQPMVVGEAVLGSIAVEGAFDVAALVECGLDALYRCVGLLGTGHARAPVHLVSPVWIWLDQDRAGKEAALRLADALGERGAVCRVPFDLDRHERAPAAEAALGQALLARGLAMPVRWAGAVKDPGDLCALGERGRAMVEQALGDRRSR